MRGRAEAATRARALLAVGAREARAASEALRGIDREIAAVDGALDSVLGILRSPSERAARKRTRVAALEIAQGRLDAVAGLLRPDLSTEALERLDMRAPRFDVVAGDGPGQVVVELLPR